MIVFGVNRSNWVSNQSYLLFSLFATTYTCTMRHSFFHTPTWHTQIHSSTRTKIPGSHDTYTYKYSYPYTHKHTYTLCSSKLRCASSGWSSLAICQSTQQPGFHEQACRKQTPSASILILRTKLLYVLDIKIKSRVGFRFVHNFSICHNNFFSLHFWLSQICASERRSICACICISHMCVYGYISVNVRAYARVYLRVHVRVLDWPPAVHCSKILEAWSDVDNIWKRVRSGWWLCGVPMPKSRLQSTFNWRLYYYTPSVSLRVVLLKLTIGIPAGDACVYVALFEKEGKED